MVWQYKQKPKLPMEERVKGFVDGGKDFAQHPPYQKTMPRDFYEEMR